MCAKCDRRDALIAEEIRYANNGQFSKARELEMERRKFELENGWGGDEEGFPVAGVEEEILNVIKGAFGGEKVAPKVPTLEEQQFMLNQFVVSLDVPIDAAWEVRRKMIEKGFPETVADQVSVMMITRAVGGI